ncbi:MAG: hypothetical protein K0U84_20285 [Actinomycetia bacterium]|nr:hypothetical protein [Actinomycetes bacterium]
MFVAKWYTRASRIRIVIAKFDGRWKLPGGPYPIPELVAVVGGLLLTLFMLPRLGQPLLTGAVGITATVAAVGVMRKMSYSPVPFGTRIHRILRLYTGPVSVSTTDLDHSTAVSTVRPQVEILDVIGVQAPHRAVGGWGATGLAPAPADRGAEAQGFSAMFGHQHSAAAQLFG